MTPPVPHAVATEVAVWNAAQGEPRRVGREMPVGRLPLLVS